MGLILTAMLYDFIPCHWQDARFITIKYSKLHKNLIFNSDVPVRQINMTGTIGFE